MTNVVKTIHVLDIKIRFLTVFFPYRKPTKTCYVKVNHQVFPFWQILYFIIPQPAVKCTLGKYLYMAFPRFL